MRSTGAEVVKIAIAAQRLDRHAAADGSGVGIPSSPTRTAWTVTCCSRWGRPACRRASSPRGSATGGPTPATASRPGQMPAARLLRRFRFRRIRAGRRALRRGRQPDRALALAGDAQRRVRRARAERRLRAAPGAPTPTTSSPSRARPAMRGRQHHRAVQGRRCSSQVDEIDADRPARRRRQHARRARRPLDRREHRRRRIPRAAGRPHGAQGHARGGARRRRRRAGGRGRARVAGRGGDDLRAAGRTRRARSRALAGGVVGTWPPRAGQLGRARQRHVVRAAAGRSTIRWPACRSTARSCSTWSTRRPDTPLIDARAQRGLPDDRRPRDARRAGRAAVRAVDRPAPARRALQRGRRSGDRRGPRRDDRQGSAVKQTTFEEFVELARRGTFVPVVKEIIADLLTPVSAFLKIAEHSDYAFLFESVEGGEQVARYSFLGKDPFLVLRSRGGRTIIDRSGVTTRERRAVRDRAAPADGRVPVAVRARPAAVHRRRGRLHRLRRVAGVRAGAARRVGAGAVGDDGTPTRDRRRSRLHAVRHGAGVRSREAPDPDHRQRADHGRRGSRGALPVRLREDPVPRARARARPVAAGAGDAGRRPTFART